MGNKIPRIAFFVEGLSETIFIRTLLLRTFNNSLVQVRCIRLLNTFKGPPCYSFLNKNAKLSFLIADVEGEGNVISAIKERKDNFLSLDYKKIIGLKDMYSDGYSRISPRKIDDKVTSQFFSRTAKEISKMGSDRIKFHFAVMELEAWFLAMDGLLEKIDSRLTSEFLKKRLGYDLSRVDPEVYYFKPSSDFKKILRLADKSYNKSKGVLEGIMGKMTKDDFINLSQAGKVGHYKIFLTEVHSGLGSYLI